METLSLVAVKALEGGGGGGDVTPDGITTEFNESEELQANAVIHVTTLPNSGIKDSSLYHVNETVTYTVDGDTETFTMSKFFRHEDGAWVSYTTISGLTQADYDHLTAAQKADGTNYIVNGGGRVTRMVYAALDGKPTLNSVTIDGDLTLEDVNVYSIDEVDDLLEQKMAAEFVDQLPATLATNTWYYSKRYMDGTLVPNDNRALYVKDKDDNVQYMGVIGQVELDNYYTKTESDERYQQLITDSTVSEVTDASYLSDTNATAKTNARVTLASVWTWIVGKLTANTDRGLSVSGGKVGITNSVTADSTSGLKFFTHDARGLVTASTAKTLGRGLSDSSNTIGHSNTAITANTTNGLKTFAVDSYGHTTAYTAKTLGRGISDSSNVIGHSNTAITAKTNNNVVGVQWDGYGHITGKGTEHSISSEYKTGASNQLFTRNGANALYSGVYNGDSNVVFCGNVTRNSTQSVNANTWTAIALTGSDVYRTGLISLASSGVKILKAGTYKFEFVIRLADTASATRHWCISAGTSSAFDDSGGGQWLYTYFRHKAEASHLRYCSANEVIKPYVYIDGNAGTVQFATVRVFKLNEK